MAFHKQFPSAEFYVLLYPGVTRGKDIIPYLTQAGVKYFDYSHFIRLATASLDPRRGRASDSTRAQDCRCTAREKSRDI